MPVFAAVDIGANSVRLKIARLLRRRVEVLHEDREVTRLGESVFRSGLLEPAVMERTIRVLRRFHRAAQEHGADGVRVVATSPLRDARNAAAFIDWVRASTGWQVQVISGLEEGRLIHLGILANQRLSASRVLMIDLGGGSCELTVSVKRHIKRMYSLSLGAVRLTEEFLRHDPPKKKELQRLQGFIRREVQRVASKITSARVQTTIATSGTAAALGAVAHAEGSSRSANSISTASLQELATRLAKRPLQERARMPGIGLRRAEIIVAGAAVFAELMERFGLPSYRYSPLGLRDGVLAQMAAESDRSTRSRRQIESDRSDSLLAIARHYRADMRFARDVCDLSLQLFSALKGVHQLPAEYKEWLAAAAMLHEVGGYVNRSSLHRHSHYIIANSEILGFTPEQRSVIAAIARYLGKSTPAASDRYLKLVPSAERARVPKAVVLLRLARALNQSRRGAVKAVRARQQDGRVLLSVQTKRTGADLEIWALRKEGSYFREVLGRELAVLEAS
jgi:exopolyphosphatase/guanosine-5'-triphosphate,3'-diphosphate pyrophosphatase